MKPLHLCAKSQYGLIRITIPQCNHKGDFQCIAEKRCIVNNLFCNTHLLIMVAFPQTFVGSKQYIAVQGIVFTEYRKNYIIYYRISSGSSARVHKIYLCLRLPHIFLLAPKINVLYESSIKLRQGHILALAG